VVAARPRVAVVNDYEIIVAGLAALLEQFPDRLEVVEQVVIGEPITEPVDVALYDTYGRVGIAAPALRALHDTPEVQHVAMFSLDLGPDLIAEGRAAGAEGFISKALPAEEITRALVRVARGELVVAAPSTSRAPSATLAWPAKEEGLTERESQVLVLASEGLSNREIGAALYLSAETVKAHLRQIFRKLEVRNRVEATNFVRASTSFRHRLAAPPSSSDGAR
jgi:two-component system, NarL family, response regulator LiaR